MRYEGYNIILHLWHRLLVGGKCNKNDSRTFMTKLTRSSNVLLFYLSFSLSLSRNCCHLSRPWYSDTRYPWYKEIDGHRWISVSSIFKLISAVNAGKGFLTSCVSMMDKPTAHFHVRLPKTT